MGGHKSWGGTKMWGNGIVGLLSSHLLLLMFFDLMCVWGARQCWEQERTTCSGGYPSATCSAFLHYCESCIPLFSIMMVWGNVY